jgi:hypothetical protein
LKQHNAGTNGPNCIGLAAFFIILNLVEHTLQSKNLFSISRQAAKLTGLCHLKVDLQAIEAKLHANVL